MTISSDQITHIAKLARLKTDPEQAAFYAHQLTEIVSLIEQMNQIDTTDIEPMSHPQDAHLRLRADEVTETDQSEAFQALAPATENGLYLVPQAIE